MDNEEFKNNFLKYYKKLYCIAFKLLNNQESSEDLIQEVYFKLWKNRKKLMHVENYEAYCVMITKNMCYDVLRSKSYKIHQESIDINEIKEQMSCADSNAIVDKSSYKLVQKIIDSLPLKQKKVIILKEIKALSFKEIGYITGVNESNVRVILSRARKKIREQFIKLNNYEQL